MVNHRGGRRDSFPHRLLSFLINLTKYIFVSSSRLVFLLELGITFAYIKLISKLLNPNNHQHNKTTKLQLCWRYIINRNEHQYPPKKEENGVKNYEKTIAVSRIMNKLINYPKCTRQPYELASFKNQQNRKI